jgi:hypothetical protein
MDIDAGMAKPIHREMRGLMSIMLLVVELVAWALCWLTALVFIEIKEKRKLVPAEMIGMRNRPTEPQLIPSAQNFQLGVLARLTPRKLKLRAFRLSLKAATAGLDTTALKWRASRSAAVS